MLYQFLPNALLFLAMYTIIPAVLSRLAKFERHVTVSGEQQAVLAKMVFFFLINLFLLKVPPSLPPSLPPSPLIHSPCTTITDGNFRIPNSF